MKQMEIRSAANGWIVTTYFAYGLPQDHLIKSRDPDALGAFVAKLANEKEMNKHIKDE